MQVLRSYTIIRYGTSHCTDEEIQSWSLQALLSIVKVTNTFIKRQEELTLPSHSSQVVPSQWMYAICRWKYEAMVVVYSASLVVGSFGYTGNHQNYFFPKVWPRTVFLYQSCGNKTLQYIYFLLVTKVLHTASFVFRLGLWLKFFLL